VYFTKLTCTSRLFLMTICGFGGLGYGFSIRYSWRQEIYWNLINVFDEPLLNVKMEFSLSTHDKLSEFFRLLDNERGIDFCQIIENQYHFFVISAIFSLYRKRDFGCRKNNGFNFDIGSFGRIQGMVGTYILQLYGSGNIPWHHFFDFLTISASHGKKLRHPLLRTILGIYHIHGFGDLTGIYLEEAHFAQMGFHGGFEYKSTSWIGWIVSNFIPINSFGSWCFIRRRHRTYNKLHQTTNPQILLGMNTKNREDSTIDQTYLQTFTDFFFS